MLVHVTDQAARNVGPERGTADDSLKGLKGVGVLVEQLEPSDRKVGLSASVLKTTVELQLRRNGIQVLTQKERDETSDRAYLYIVQKPHLVTRMNFGHVKSK